MRSSVGSAKWFSSVVATAVLVQMQAASGQIKLPPELERKKAIENHKKIFDPNFKGNKIQEMRGKHLLGEYRKYHNNPTKRFLLARQLKSLGQPSYGRILKIVERDLNKQIAAYTQTFQQAAKQVTADRIREAGDGVIDKLRNDVAKTLKKTTKENIKKWATPALNKLKTHLLFDRQEVIKRSKAVRDQRAALELEAKTWKMLTDKKLEDLILPAETSATSAAIIGSADAIAILNANRLLLAKLDPQEAEGIRYLNQIRILVGMKPLAIDMKLVKASRGHSSDMKQHKFFSHTSPLSGKKTPWDRAKLAGTRASGENIAAGTNSGRGAIHMWWNSPGHFKNMLGKHRRIGLGKNGRLWTQMFG